MERLSRGIAGLAMVVTSMARPPRRAEVICMVDWDEKAEVRMCGWLVEVWDELDESEAGIEGRRRWHYIYVLPKLLDLSQGKLGLSWPLSYIKTSTDSPHPSLRSSLSRLAPGLIALEAYACEASPAVCPCPPTRLGPMARGQE